MPNFNDRATQEPVTMDRIREAISAEGCAEWETPDRILVRIYITALSVVLDLLVIAVMESPDWTGFSSIPMSAPDAHLDQALADAYLDLTTKRDGVLRARNYA